MSTDEISFGILETEPSPYGGILVKKVSKFSSAGMAGIQKGDEIVTFAGLPAPDAAARLLEILTAAGIGGVIPVRIRRADQEFDIAMKLVKERRLNLSLDDVDLTLERKIAP